MNVTSITARRRCESAGATAWLPCLLALALGPLGPDAVAQPVLQFGTDGAAQGRAVQIPLRLAGAVNLAGLQVDLGFDPCFVETNAFSVTTSLPGVLADGGVVSSNRFRVLLLSTNHTPLPNGLVASVTFTSRSNSPNGLMRVPLRSQPAGVGVTLTTNGTCGAALVYEAGQFLVGDAFGFVPEGGRVQFRTANGITNVIVAISNLSTNLAEWTPIGTNIGVNDLVIWIDRDATNLVRRFYHSRAP